MKERKERTAANLAEQTVFWPSLNHQCNGNGLRIYVERIKMLNGPYWVRLDGTGIFEWEEINRKKH